MATTKIKNGIKVMDLNFEMEFKKETGDYGDHTAVFKDLFGIDDFDKII